MNEKLKSWFGIKMKTITLYTKFKEYVFGKANGIFLNQIFGTAAMLFSPGAFIAGCIDIHLDNVYNGRLWKIYG